MLKNRFADNTVLFPRWRRSGLPQAAAAGGRSSAINASSLTVKAFLDMQDDTRQNWLCASLIRYARRHLRTVRRGLFAKVKSRFLW